MKEAYEGKILIRMISKIRSDMVKAISDMYAESDSSSGEQFWQRFEHREICECPTLFSAYISDIEEFLLKEQSQGGDETNGGNI